MSAVIVALVILGADADDPSTKAMAAQTQHVLGTSSTVIVREVVALPPDADAIKLEESLKAGALIELEWKTVDHREARLRVHAKGTWSVREVTFTASDAPAERGRTLALAATSMLPEPTADPAPEPMQPATPAPTLSPPPVRDLPPAPTHTARRRFLIDLGGTAALSAGSDARAFGADVGVGFAPWSSVALRGSFGARTGSIDAIAGSSTTMRIGLGALVTLISLDRLQIGLRVEGRALRVQVGRPESGNVPASSDARWVPAGASMVEAALTFGSASALVLAGGVEQTFGTSAVTVSGARAATLGRTRGVFELAFRIFL